MAKEQKRTPVTFQRTIAQPNGAYCRGSMLGEKCTWKMEASVVKMNAVVRVKAKEHVQAHPSHVVWVNEITRLTYYAE